MKGLASSRTPRQDDNAVALLRQLPALDPDGYRSALTRLITNADASARTQVVG